MGVESVTKQAMGNQPRLIKLVNSAKSLNLGSFVLLAYTLFIAGYFFIPNGVDLYKYYIVAVFLPGLVYSFRTFGLIGRSKLLLATLLCLAYLLSTSFWSQGFSLNTLWYDTRLTAYIVGFLLLTVTIGIRAGGELETILKLICVAAAVSALVSIAYWYWRHPFPESRLISIGILDSPNHSSSIYGFFCLLSGYYGLQSTRPLNRVLYVSAAVVLLVFVFFTQSRTGILATLFSFSLLAVFSFRHKKMVFGIAVLIGVLLVSLHLAYPVVLSRLNDMSVPNRLGIWRQALDLFIASPYFGQGYQTTFQATLPGSSYIFHSAHNTFIATLRDGGLLGLGFYLYMLVVAIRVGLSELVKRGSSIYLLLLVFSFICTSMSTDRLITRPRELWIILWLPLALLVIREIRNSSGAANR